MASNEIPNVMKTPKGTELPLLNLRGKIYLQVAHRLVWFREEHPNWTIRTKLEPDFQQKRCVATAEIYDDQDKLVAMAHKVEDEKGFQDFVEKSETGAIGRALALCGYGTQFADDFDEGDRLADSPVAPKPAQKAKPAQIQNAKVPEGQKTENEAKSNLNANPTKEVEIDPLDKIKVQCTVCGKDLVRSDKQAHVLYCELAKVENNVRGHTILKTITAINAAKKFVSGQPSGGTDQK